MAVLMSKAVTTMCRHFDEDERQTDEFKILGFNQISIGEQVCT